INAASAQTIADIDLRKARIDNLQFTDTVLINDTVYDLLSKEREIIGYLHKDTLLKTISRFKNSNRVRIAYYSGKRNYSDNGIVIYLKEYDEITQQLLTEVYAHENHKPYLEPVIISAILIATLNEDEQKSTSLLLSRSNYNYQINAKLVDEKAIK